MRGRAGSSVAGLPAEVTSFVGRHQESMQVKRLLSASRLVTLTGVGGVGKSRLALHVAREMRRVYPDGAWLVELAKLHDPSLVNHAVVDTLELRDQSARDPGAVLVQHLAEKRLLLVLDNCEHVLDGCRWLATALLARAPGVTVLATSRESLAVSGESVFAVPPLPVPPNLEPHGYQPELAPGPYDSLLLFEARAAAVVADFAPSPESRAAAAEVCRRLEGLPLAIELAAVRVRALSVPQILARLEDRYRLLSRGDRTAPPRHQALRSAIEWSFDLCSDTERTLWARASVFAGGFDLGAAEHVCAGDGLAAEDVLGVVTTLIDKSILDRYDSGPSARYRMLETIRQYGRERLAERGEEATVRRRHRDYYLRVAQEADADSFGPRQLEWFSRLREERPNLWLALDYCLTKPGQARCGLRMAGALWVYWVACGLVRDGRYWLGRALAADTAASRERAKALWVDGWIACLQGDTTAALTLLDEGRALARQLGDEQALTRATQFTGTAHMFRNELRRAVPFMDQVLARYRESGEVSGPAVIAFVERADAAFMLGDIDRASALCEDGKRLCEAQGERWALSWVMWLVGLIAWVHGDLRGATAHIRESLLTKTALKDQLAIPFCLELLAWIATSAANFERGAVLLGAADSMWRTIGAPLFGFEALLGWRTRCVEAIRRAMGDHAFDGARQRGMRLPSDAAVMHALDRKHVRVPAADDDPPQPEITRREREVAALVAHGLSNQEIADRLAISRRTAECHVAHIFSKLGFTSRAQIAGWIRG